MAVVPHSMMRTGVTNEKKKINKQKQAFGVGGEGVKVGGSSEQSGIVGGASRPVVECARSMSAKGRMGRSRVGCKLKTVK
ncbi:hypothetical protein NHX12_026297 [Muraenolepis orangiensis]|uniref:Uncharacterized protein n=1 Tax=Muraenolepis orangiensis TaxID=630683 RepID=A0A9Q0IQL3_9TELE|nr:hypothetical protein NHX12_026297 [Muraenolepis orangiensis]